MEKDFIEFLTLQARALDTHGAWKTSEDDVLLERIFIRPKDESGQPIALSPEQLVRLQLQAAANVLERSEGAIPTVVCEAGCDGSIKGYVITGKVITLQKMFWNTGDFRYASMEKLKKKGTRIAGELLENYRKYGEKHAELLAM